MEKVNCFIIFILLIVLWIFMPSFYRYLYKSNIGRLFIILGIIYLCRISFFAALLFTSFIIIASYDYYEGFLS